MCPNSVWKNGSVEEDEELFFISNVKNYRLNVNQEECTTMSSWRIAFRARPVIDERNHRLIPRRPNCLPIA